LSYASAPSGTEARKEARPSQGSLASVEGAYRGYLASDRTCFRTALISVSVKMPPQAGMPPLPWRITSSSCSSVRVLMYLPSV